VAKEDKAHHTKKLEEYSGKQSKTTAANNGLSAEEKKELKARIKAKITYIKKALKGTELLIKSRRAEIRAQVTHESEEREHAHKRKKSEQEDLGTFPPVSIYLILLPSCTYLLGTADTHDPLRGTPPLAGGTRPHYAALRPTWPYGLLTGPTALYLALRPTWPYGPVPLPSYREHAPTPYYSGGITPSGGCTRSIPYPRCRNVSIPHTYPYLRWGGYTTVTGKTRTTTPYAYRLTLPYPQNLRTRPSGNRIRRLQGHTTCQHYGSLGDREGEGQEKGHPLSV
jgi:hypothetical protein